MKYRIEALTKRKGFCTQLVNLTPPHCPISSLHSLNKPFPAIVQ